MVKHDGSFIFGCQSLLLHHCQRFVGALDLSNWSRDNWLESLIVVKCVRRASLGAQTTHFPCSKSCVQTAGPAGWLCLWCVVCLNQQEKSKEPLLDTLMCGIGNQSKTRTQTVFSIYLHTYTICYFSLNSIEAKGTKAASIGFAL